MKMQKCLPLASVQIPVGVWHNDGEMPKSTRTTAPLDAAGLDRLALRYVERFATTRARLAAYLTRKIRERGWEGPTVEPASVAERLAALGYIDDRSYGEAKVRSLGARGYGARRVDGALRYAGLEEDDRASLADDIAAQGIAAAITFAKRRRIGPFGSAEPDRLQREKQLAAMLRAGHDFAVARRIVAMAPGEDVDALLTS